MICIAMHTIIIVQNRFPVKVLIVNIILCEKTGHCCLQHGQTCQFRVTRHQAQYDHLIPSNNNQTVTTRMTEDLHNHLRKRNVIILRLIEDQITKCFKHEQH